MALTENQVKKISLAYQANEGNAEGIAYWVNSGVNDATAASIFYAANTSLQSLSGLALATKIFENLGLNAETHPGFNQEGIAFWGNLIDSGAVAKDQSGLVIANAVRDDLGLTDDTFTQHIEKIKNITPSGETFMLTAGVDVASTNVAYHGNMQNPDTFRFTDANETIEATTLTLGSGDNFTDGNDKDKDVLHITLQNYDVSKTIGTGSGEVGNGVTINGIEVLDIDATAGGANTITYKGGFTSITDLIIRGAFDATTGTGLNVSVSSDSALKTVDLTGVSYAGGSGLVFTAGTNANDLTISGPSFNASITGGNGNDTITAQGTINGGSGNDIITGKGSINGSGGNDTITATGLSTIDGDDGNDTISGYGSITGGSGDDIITLTGVSTVVGGKGADTITTSTEGVVTFKYSSAGETAQGSGVASSAAFKTVAAASLTADTLTVKVGDKIDLSDITLVKTAILQNDGSAYKLADDLEVTDGTGDVFLLENGDTYLLAYEISDGSTSFGSGSSGFEVIKLVGLTGANKITLENGIVTIV